LIPPQLDDHQLQQHVSQSKNTLDSMRGPDYVGAFKQHPDVFSSIQDCKDLKNALGKLSDAINEYNLIIDDVNRILGVLKEIKFKLTITYALVVAQPFEIDDNSVRVDTDTIFQTVIQDLGMLALALAFESPELGAALGLLDVILELIYAEECIGIYNQAAPKGWQVFLHYMDHLSPPLRFVNQVMGCMETIFRPLVETYEALNGPRIEKNFSFSTLNDVFEFIISSKLGKTIVSIYKYALSSERRDWQSASDMRADLEDEFRDTLDMSNSPYAPDLIDKIFQSLFELWQKTVHDKQQ